MNLARTRMTTGAAVDMRARFAANEYAVVEVAETAKGEPAAIIVSPGFFAMLVNGYDAAALLLQGPDLPRLREEYQRMRGLALRFLGELERVKGRDYRVSPECWRQVREASLFDQLDRAGPQARLAIPEPAEDRVFVMDQVGEAAEEMPPPLEG